VTARNVVTPGEPGANRLEPSGAQASLPRSFVEGRLAMQRLVFGLAVLMMVVWTAIVVADLVVSIGSAGWLAAAAQEGVTPAGARGMFDAFRADFWGAAAQARAIVWGLPMTAFALIAALTQRPT
jgi:hypothetical protein